MGSVLKRDRGYVKNNRGAFGKQERYVLKREEGYFEKRCPICCELMEY